MFCLRGEATLLLRPWMLGNQRSPVIETNKPGTCLDIDMAANQRVEDRVRMFAVQHVVVWADLCPTDINVFVPVWRECLQRGFIQLFIQAFPATR